MKVEIAKAEWKNAIGTLNEATILASAAATREPNPGQVASAVTGLYPWLGYKASEGVTV